MRALLSRFAPDLQIVVDLCSAACAGDKSTLSKVDVYLESLFKKKDKDKKSGYCSACKPSYHSVLKVVVLALPSCLFRTPSHPLGGLYAFRRGDDGNFTKTLSML